MHFRKPLFTLLPCLVLVLWLVSRPGSGHTRLELRDGASGGELASFVLGDGERVLLTWRNSLWGLNVTEAFVAESGLLIQTEVTFSPADGSQPPTVAPQDVDDLYQTGGAFTAKGLARPLRRVVYRIGEIGNPMMKVRDTPIAFMPLVGFGGRVVLTAGMPLRYEILAAWLFSRRPWP